MSKRNILIFIWVASGIFLFTTVPEKITICGDVVKKYTSNETYGEGRQIYTELAHYLDVKFPNEYETVKVTTDTYYTSNIGDEVCFKRNTDEREIYYICISIYIVISLIFFINILIPQSWPL